VNNIFTKLRDFVGLNDPADYDYDYEESDAEEYQTIYREQNTQPPAPEISTSVSEDARGRRRMRERPSLSSEVGLGSSIPSAPMSNVIGMPGASGSLSEVVVMEPRSFEEMPQAIQALRERKSVVLNLNVMDADQAQRAVDFVAGGTYAIDGHQERIGESIFLFTPSCVQVVTQASSAQEQAQPQPRSTSGRSTTAPTPAWATSDAPSSSARMA